MKLLDGSVIDVLSNVLRTNRIRLFGVYFLILIGAMLEMLSLGALVPVGGLLLAGGAEDINFFGMQIKLTKDMYVIVLASVVVIYIFKSLYMLLMYNKVFKFVYHGYKLAADLLFHNYIFAPLEKVENRNQEEVISRITYSLYYCYHGFLIPVVNLVVEVTIVGFIVLFMLFLQPLVALSMLVVVSVSAFLVKLFIGSKLECEGRRQRNAQEGIVGMVNSAILGLKELKSTGSECYVENKFNRFTTEFSDASKTIHLFRQLPRYLVEAIIVSMIILLMVAVVESEDKSIISVLPVFIIGAIRIAPSLNKIVSNYTAIKAYKETAFIVDDELNDIADDDNKSINSSEVDLNPSWNSIILKDIKYEYKKGVSILNGVNLRINKGEKIVILGASGSGKSTLLEIISGIRQMTSGEVFLDNININTNSIQWKEMGGYVSQFPFIFDGSVMENILLSDNDLDEGRLESSIIKARVKEFVDDAESFLIQCSGKNLSGGQIQRIGIARALYNNYGLILLDEFTASLDQENTKLITNELLLDDDLTIIAVTHDKNLAMMFGKAYEMNDGELRGINSNQI